MKKVKVNMGGRPSQFNKIRDQVAQMRPDRIREKFKVSRATAYRWLSRIAEDDREGK